MTATAHIARVDGRILAFANPEHRDWLIRQWRRGPATAEDWTAEQWQQLHPGGWPLWDRVPDWRIVHARTATLQPDGTITFDTGLWHCQAWEFEPDLYTTEDAEVRVERRPGVGGRERIEVHARGLDPAAVTDAFARELARQLSALAKGGDAR